MKHSSRKDPCPVCGRDTDDKCRWNDFNIFCYCGDSFHPPTALRLGEFVQAFGQNWKLVKYDGGFSGGSYIFVIAANDQTPRRYTKEEREQYRKQIDFIAHKSKRLLFHLRKLVQKSYGLQPFSTMDLEQLRSANDLLKQTLDDCDYAIKFVAQNRRSIPNAKKLSMAFFLWRNRVRYQKNDFDIFVSQCLGIL